MGAIPSVNELILAFILSFEPCDAPLITWLVVDGGVGSFSATSFFVITFSWYLFTVDGSHTPNGIDNSGIKFVSMDKGDAVSDIGTDEVM